MTRYSVQQAYHTRKWYVSIFLSLFDLAIVNTYILHNSALSAGKPKRLSWPEFMYALIDEMIHYVHMSDVRGVRRKVCSNKISEDTIAAGHTLLQMLPKDVAPDPNARSTRSKKTKATAVLLMYGHSGKEQHFQDCVTCKKINGLYVKTKYCCHMCQHALCKDTPDCYITLCSSA